MDTTLSEALAAFVALSPAVDGCVAHVIDEDGNGSTATAGWADRVAQRAITADATFRIASSTKTFTAAATLRLVEAGVIELDGEAGEHLGHTVAERLSLGGITFRHLLQHTSGLPDMDGVTFMDELRANPSKRWPPWEKIERSIVGRERTGPAGPPARYSDVGYIVLARSSRP